MGLGRGDDGGPALLERELELRTVDGCLQAALEGDGATLLIEGPAGIGKTALLRAAIARARELGMRTLATAGSEFEGAVAFGVVRHLAAPLAPGDPPPDALLGRVVAAAHAEPLLFVGDDLQWADASSLRFLAVLAQRLEGSRSVLAIAIRSGETPNDAGLLDALAERASRRLRPPPLGPAAAEALATAAFADRVDPAFAEACFEVTGGNPYALGELLAALRQERVAPRADARPAVQAVGSRTTIRLVRRRLRALPADAVAAAQAAAVLGSAAAPDLVVGLAELDPERAADALSALTAAELVRPATRDEVRFSHPLVRAAVLDAMDGARRAGLRTAAVAALSARGDVEAAAEQLLDVAPAGDAARAAVLEQAASRAAVRGAPEVVVALTRRALAEPPAPDRVPPLLTALGAAQAELGSATAIDTLREALDATNDPRCAATVAGTLSWALAAQGRGAEGVAVLERLRSRMPADAEPAVTEALDAQLAEQGSWEVELRPARDAAIVRLREADARTALGRAAVLAAETMDAAAACRPAGEVAALAEAVLADDEPLSDRRIAPTLTSMAVLLAVCGRPDLAETHLRRARLPWRRQGAVVFVRATDAVLGMVELERGRLAAAEALLRGSLDPDPLAPEASPLVRATPVFVSFLVRCLVARGHHEEAAAIVHDTGLDGPLSPLVAVTPMLHARALLRRLRDDLRGARADLERCGERLEREGQRNPAIVPWRSALAEVLLAVGEPRARACALTAEELELAERFGAPHAVGAALRAHGAALAGADGIAVLRRAVVTLEPTFARLELARAQAALGAELLRAGDKVAAREPLHAALALAREAGAEPLARESSARLHEAGGRVRRGDRPGSGRLSPAERRVAERAAAGASNREIADALFLSPKTVESHLRATFRKLAIGSRTQLPEALREGG